MHSLRGAICQPSTSRWAWPVPYILSAADHCCSFCCYVVLELLVWCIYTRCWDSAAGIAIRLRTGRPRNRGSRILSSSQISQQLRLTACVIPRIGRLMEQKSLAFNKMYCVVAAMDSVFHNSIPPFKKPIADWPKRCQLSA